MGVCDDVAIYCGSQTSYGELCCALKLLWYSGDNTLCREVSIALIDIVQRNRGNLRLVRGWSSESFYTSGRLEIFLRGEWGTVCNEFWNSVNSDVACRQLGFSGAAHPTSYDRSTYVG